MENLELYLIAGLTLFLIWFIYNTVKYYYGEKRKMKNLHRFAKEGEVEAQHDLAHSYEEGKVVKKDLKKAAFWYQQAAFSGDEEAKGELKKFLHEERTKRRYSPKVN